MNNCLITGAAGFIGFHFALEMLKNDYHVIGIDNMNSYYDKKLKESRVQEIEKFTERNNCLWNFFMGDIEDNNFLDKIISKYNPKYIVHLAAQAGVRYSIENPRAYINSNIVGFSNIIDLCVKYNIEHFIYASSSSVYGGNTKIPFSEQDPVNHPVSLYAATKRSNELIAHSYSHIHGLPCTGIRFFTVYGPWGRPDMAPIIFANAIINKKPLKIFNNGNMFRDFTYIDDVIEALTKLINKPSVGNNSYDSNKSDPSKSWCNFQIFNIGNNCPINLMEFIEVLEKEIGIKAIKKYYPMQAGDVKTTCADTRNIEEYLELSTKTSLVIGVKKFINWYKQYY